MPQGINREEQNEFMPIIADLCKKYNVNMSFRGHIIIWDIQKGV